MAEEQIVEKSAQPVSIQHAPAYLTRQPLYITNPTLFTADQWRLVAKEPITKLCIRHINREISALEYKITSENDGDEDTIKYYTDKFDNADDGDGWDIWISRMLQDAMILSIGGNSEAAPDDITGMLGGLYHIDGATLYPTYDPSIPFVQINPYNGLDRVYFLKNDVLRLILQPRTDLLRKMFQEAPVESAFPAIDALAKIYMFYIKQLSDTPMAGVLDLMDMKESEVIDWAKSFREMFEGIDPLKIPLLYDHTKPAKFIPFGRTPQDMSIIETFKHFTEMVCSAFGLSITDLRIFEHMNTRAGSDASQKVTARSGVGYYAQAIEDLINNKILKTAISGIKFAFVLGATGQEQAEATLNLTRAQTLIALVGTNPILKPQDALAQADKWGIITVPTTGTPQPPGLEGLGLTGDNLDSMNQDAGAVQQLSDTNNAPDALQQINTANDQMGQFKSLIVTKSKRTDTLARFVRLMKASFEQVGADITEADIQKILDKVELKIDKSLVDTDYESVLTKAVDTASDKLDELLADEDWYNLPDIMGEVSDILKTAYEEGSLVSIDEMQAKGFAAGFTTKQNPPEIDFRLTNQHVLDLIDEHGLKLVQQVDDGTRYYLKRYILAGSADGIPTSDIVKGIQENIFGFRKPAGAKTLSDSRVNSIVNTELNWADSRANFDQMVAVGLETKCWRTRDTDACDICLANEAKGYVEMDYEYETVFGDETTLHPPAHPNTCHCYGDSNPKELEKFFESGDKYWSGGAFDKQLKQSVEEETQRILDERENKSLPPEPWGIPSPSDKRSRFGNVADAQHYLTQFSLVPVISNSDIDVKDANYEYAGIVWGKDGDPYVEAQLVTSDQLPLDDIKSGKAKIFGAKGIKKSTAFDAYTENVPGTYRKEFADFVRERTNGGDPEAVDEINAERYWKDFMRTLLVGGFEYDQTYVDDPLVRSVVKSNRHFSGYEVSSGVDPLVKALIQDDEPNLPLAVKFLLKKGFTVKAFYTGAGYSGVHDPDYDMPPDTSFFNRTNFERLKRSKNLLIDGTTIRTQVAEDNAGDPVTKLYDVATFNSAQSLEDWMKKVRARPVGGKQYEIADLVAGDNTWPS